MTKNATYLTKILLLTTVLLISVTTVSAGGVSHMTQTTGTGDVPLGYDASYYQWANSFKANHTFILNTVYLTLGRTATTPKWYYSVSIYAANATTGFKKPTGAALASSGIYPASQLGTTVSSLYHNLTTNVTLTAGTYYFIALRMYNGSTSTTVYVNIRTNAAGTNNSVLGWVNGTWGVHDVSRDLIYNLYGYTYVPGASGHPTLAIKAYDYYNNNSIENFTAVFTNGTTRTTSNGTINTLAPIGNHSFVLRYIRDTTSGQYFNLSGNWINAVANATTYTKPFYPKNSQVNFTNRQLVFNATLAGVTYYLNGTLGTTFYPRAGYNYRVIAVKAGYFNKTQYFNVTALDNKTVNVTGLYNTRVLISPRDILNNNTISGANITIRNITTPYYTARTNVTNATFNITSGVYEVTISADGRITYQENITIGVGTYTHYLYLAAYNSVIVYAFNQETGAAITGFNVSIYNSLHSYSNVTAISYALISDIISGNYTVVVSATNYTNAYYTVTVTDNSNQTLNAYLTSATDILTITLRDRNTNEGVSGGSIVMKRIINGTLTTVSSKTSDIAGAATFIYGGGIVYTFVISKTGYESRIFNFEPALDAYTVLLTPEVTTNTTIRINDVVYTIDAYKFANNNLSFITVTFNSGDGTLEYYRVYINNSYNSTAVSGVNAAGGTLNATRYLTGVTIGSTTKVTIIYKSTLDAAEYRITLVYPIRGYAVGTATLEDMKNDLDELGELEKGLLGTFIIGLFITVFYIGASGLGQGLIGGSVGGLFGVALVGKIGLFPLPVLFISALAFALIVVTRLNTNE